MKWFKVYAWIARRIGLSRMILDRANSKPYLERFYLVPRWLMLGKGRWVIHRFWKSDDDNAYHDHPWPWKSKILEGGYVEYTPTGVNHRKVGDVTGLRPAEFLHYVILTDKEVWTLFYMGKGQREWGFVPLGTNDWIHHKKYLRPS